MKVVGLSLITNKVIINKEENQVHASHAEVLAATGNIYYLYSYTLFQLSNIINLL